VVPYLTAHQALGHPWPTILSTLTAAARHRLHAIGPCRLAAAARHRLHAIGPSHLAAAAAHADVHEDRVIYAVASVVIEDYRAAYADAALGTPPPSPPSAAVAGGGTLRALGRGIYRTPRRERLAAPARRASRRAPSCRLERGGRRLAALLARKLEGDSSTKCNQETLAPTPKVTLLPNAPTRRGRCVPAKRAPSSVLRIRSRSAARRRACMPIRGAFMAIM
jgi:hypothetical protein